jgi:hypothetical protein
VTIVIVIVIVDNGTMKLHCRSIMRNARTVGLCHGVQPFGEKIGGDVIELK